MFVVLKLGFLESTFIAVNLFIYNNFNCVLGKYTVILGLWQMMRFMYEMNMMNRRRKIQATLRFICFTQ